MVVGEFTQEAQLAVIGGGPAGYATAFRAAELGVSTVVIDQTGALGGSCLHDGCVPSKSLVAIAAVIGAARRVEEFGIGYGKPTIDLEKLRSRIAETVDRLEGGLASRAKSLGVEVIQGRALFESSRELAIRDSTVPRVRFRRAVIATGSRPRTLPGVPGVELEDPRLMSSNQAMMLPDIPEHLLIVGSGYKAIETANIYAALGSSVTIVDENDRLIPTADQDLARPLIRHLNDTLSGVHLNISIADITGDIKPESDGLHVAFVGDPVPARTTFDRIVVAIGQAPNVEGLGLNLTGVKLNDQGFIQVDEQMRTTDPRIMAVGDITGATFLAHWALHTGRIAGEVAAGQSSSLDVRAVPMVVFSDPEMAWCGLTEQQAKELGINHEVRKLPWGASGRAMSMGRSDGMTKLILEPDTELVLGVGLVGTHAAEMIAEGALAIEMGAVAMDLATTMHPHPTMSELISDASRRHEGT